MSLPIFSAFQSTVTYFRDRVIAASDRWLIHPVTGAITGVKNPNANGADARFTPVDLTADQINNPTQAMIDDLDATYRLSEAPYSRYQSDGTQLVPIGGSNETSVVIPAGFIAAYKSPLVVSTPQELLIFGGIYVW